MKRIRKFIRSPKSTLIMFGMAIALLLFSSIGGTRAALAYFSEVYESRVEMSNIGVTLLEKNAGSKGEAKPISNRDYGNRADGDWDEKTGILLQGMLGDDEQPKPGKAYKEELSVQNTGSIDQYVRVSIYKYWIDGEKEPDGKVEKELKLDPKLIELELDPEHCGPKGSNSDWLVDDEATTDERIVLYYSKVLRADSEPSSTFTKSVKIKKSIVNRVSQEESVSTENGKTYKTIKTIYDYDGMKFCVEAKVDAVQDHNAQDAIWSAWGRKVTINNERLSLD